MTAETGRYQSTCGALHPNSDEMCAVWCTLPVGHDGHHAMTWPSDDARSQS